MEEQGHREELLQEAVAAVDVAAVVLQICRRDSRFRFGAYQWLLSEGLQHTMSSYLGLTEETRRHLTGREIVLGLRDLAREQFGPLAREVWRHWGINCTADWGRIVYNLIDAGLLHKNDDDRPEDFNDVYEVGDQL